jgi:hypothetical protein
LKKVQSKLVICDFFVAFLLFISGKLETHVVWNICAKYISSSFKTFLQTAEECCSIKDVNSQSNFYSWSVEDFLEMGMFLFSE